MSSEMLMNLRDGLLFYIMLVCSISIHEWAHAFSADKLDDPLPRLQGRVTLNPLSHIDMIGTVLIPLSMILIPILSGTRPLIGLIGWGKPVMVSLPNPKTRTRDDIIITMAGPLSNLLLCFILAITGGLLITKFPSSQVLFFQAIVINAALFCFNLIPIPPLDGSRILKHLTNMSEELYYRLASYGWIILLVLINIPFFRFFLMSFIQSVSRFFGNILFMIATKI